MSSSPKPSPTSEQRIWSSLQTRVDTIVENRNTKSSIPSQPSSGIGDVEGGECLREDDSLLLLRGFDSIASSLSQLTNNLDSALQGIKDLPESFHGNSEKVELEDEQNGNKKRRFKRKTCDSHEENVKKRLKKANKYVGFLGYMATKSVSLAKELKCFNSGLFHMQERCLLEEENKRENDDLVRLQIEALIDEKSRLARENLNLKRENKSLHQLVEYHKISSQNLYGMCSDFSLLPPIEEEEENTSDH